MFMFLFDAVDVVVVVVADEAGVFLADVDVERSELNVHFSEMDHSFSHRHNYYAPRLHAI